MPTYDYQCDACDHEFEVYESITVEPQKKCPKCKKNKLRRLFGSGAALVFKGSGFYSTDYRSDSYKKAAAAEKPSSDSASSSGEGGKSKSETKPETKPESKPKSESKSSSSKSKPSDK